MGVQGGWQMHGVWMSMSGTGERDKGKMSQGGMMKHSADTSL